MATSRRELLAPTWPRWGAALSQVLIGFELSVLIAPHLSLWPFVAYALGFGCVVGSTLLLASATPKARRAVLLVLPLALLALELTRRNGFVGVGASLTVLLALLAAGSVLGSLIGTGIEHPGHLLFVALVSALADTFSVTQPQGPSAAIAQAPQILSLLALPWPMFGTDQLAPFLGVGDVVFTAIYVAASRTHGLSMTRTMVALGAAFFVTMLTVLATALPIPALPFLGLAIVAAQPAARVPPERDRRRGFAVICVMAIAFGALLVRNLR